MSEQTPAPAAGPDRRARARAALGPDLALGLLTALAALLAAAWVLRLWRGDLAVPFSNQFDALLHAQLVKSVLDHGWYEVNNNLGAPFGQQLYDFPQNGDNLQFLLIWALGRLSSNFAVVLNVYFLATFPLVAVSAFVVLRRLGASGPVAGVCAVLYALLPYHFARRELHLFLSGYYAVPLGAYLVMATFSGMPLFTRRPPAARTSRLPRPRWTSRRTLGTLAMCAVIGSASIYYAGFTAVLLLAAIGLVIVARRDRRAALSGAGAIAAIAVVLALNFAPVGLYHLEHGSNPAVAHRRPAEAERYALRLSQLVLPVDDHRLAPLRRAKRRYVTTLEAPSRYNESYSATLGGVATVGFVWLLVVTLLALTGSGRRVLDERVRHAAAGALTAFLLATVGGISTLIAYWVTPQLRAWNRLSVFIAFFAFVSVALLLEALRRRLGAGRGRSALLGLTLAGVLVLGVLDQTTRDDIPPYRSAAAEFHSDGAFVAEIERSLPRGAAVFELPYMGFPESKPIGRMFIYDPVRGYLHSRHLRWSYGAIQGRPADWPLALADKPASLVVAAVSAAGFEGIWLDRYGYADGGDAISQALGATAGVQPLVSRNRRLEFFDLRGYAAALRAGRSATALRMLRDATLEPAIATRWSSGFGRLRQLPRHSQRALGPGALLEVVNRRTMLDATLHGVVRSRMPVLLRVSYPGGALQTLRVTPRGVLLQRTLQLAPGTSRIRFSAVPLKPGVPAAAAQVQLRDPAVLEPGLLAFA